MSSVEDIYGGDAREYSDDEDNVSRKRKRDHVDKCKAFIDELIASKAHKSGGRDTKSSGGSGAKKRRSYDDEDTDDEDDEDEELDDEAITRYGKGFIEILKSPYINLTREQLLNKLRDMANTAREVKEFNRKNPKNQKTGYLFQELDKRQKDILGPGPSWKCRLNQEQTIMKDGSVMTHYQEFFAIQGIVCSALGTHTKKCNDCKRHAKYRDDPSDLIEFIRNLHEHAEGKMLNLPGGALETILFPNGYKEKENFVDYFINKFPKLFHAIADLEKEKSDWLDWSQPCVADQVVADLWERILVELLAPLLGCESVPTWINHNIGSIVLHLKVDWEVFVNHVGTVLSADDTLRVKHKLSNPINYQITNYNSAPVRVVFGLPELKTEMLSSSIVVLITAQTETNNVSEYLQKLAPDFHNFDHEDIFAKFMLVVWYEVLNKNC